MPKILFTTSEAAAELGVTSARVRQMILKGELAAGRFGRDLMINAEAVTKAKKRKTTPGPSSLNDLDEKAAKRPRSQTYKRYNHGPARMSGQLRKRTLDVPLAIEGGAPVRTSFLPFGRPCLGEEEIEEVVTTLRSGWIGTGPRAELFEREFAEYIGVKYAISLNSCTAGLFLGLVALGVGSGDEVITTPLTFAATVNVIEHVGARPVLVDIDPQTLNIDPEKVERAVTSRTRAVIPVHFGGLASDMDALQGVADRHGLVVMEDAAHAVGTRYDGRNAGALGKLASFSFYANKNLTTAEGGMVTTNDPALAERIRTLRLHGLSSDAWNRYATRRLMKSDIVLPGYKFNMPDVSAAIGIHQLRKQERFLETRSHYARLYDGAFADLPVRFQPRADDVQRNRHSLHLYLLVLEAGRWRMHRDGVLQALLNENIGAALHYRAIHTHPFYREKYRYKPEDYPDAYHVGEHVLSLPLSPSMSEADAMDVIEAVQKVARAYAQ